MHYGGWSPLNGRPVLHMTVRRRSKSRGRGLSLRPIGCTPALSVTQQRRCSCSCRLWRYISLMPLPFTFDCGVMSDVNPLPPALLTFRPYGAYKSVHCYYNPNSQIKYLKNRKVLTSNDQRARCGFVSVFVDGVAVERVSVMQCSVLQQHRNYIVSQ